MYSKTNSPPSEIDAFITQDNRLNPPYTRPLRGKKNCKRPGSSIAERRRVHAERLIKRAVEHEHRFSSTPLESRWNQGQIAAEILGYGYDVSKLQVIEDRRGAQQGFGPWRFDTFAKAIGLRLSDMWSALCFFLNCDHEFMSTMADAQNSQGQPLFTWDELKKQLVNRYPDRTRFAKYVAGRLAQEGAPAD